MNLIHHPCTFDFTLGSNVKIFLATSIMIEPRFELVLRENNGKTDATSQEIDLITSLVAQEVVLWDSGCPGLQHIAAPKRGLPKLKIDSC